MRPALTILLRLYPSEFRNAYGRLIELQVRDQLRSARGPFTATRIITDMIRGAAAEHVSAYQEVPVPRCVAGAMPGRHPLLPR